MMALSYFRNLLIVSALLLCFAAHGTLTKSIYAETKIDVNEFNFNWKISNFSFLPQQNGEYLRSEEFYEDKDERWVIELYPKGSTLQKSEYYRYNEYVSGQDCISIFLKCVSSPRPDIHLKFSIVLLNSTGTKLASFVKDELISMSNNTSVSDPWFMRRKILFPQIPDDTLTVSCVMKVTKKVGSWGSAEKMPMPSFNRLFENGDFSDITFLVGGTKFRAHRAILASQSDVFYDMFVQNSKSNASVPFKIETTKPEVFLELLRFVYTKNANVHLYSSELLAAAEKYGLKDLKEECEKDIFKKLAEKILKIKGFYTAQEVKKEMMEYLIEHQTIYPQISDSREVELHEEQ